MPLGKEPVSAAPLFSSTVGGNFASATFAGDPAWAWWPSEAVSVVPTGYLGTDAKAPLYPYDPAKAKQLLAEAGYKDGFDIQLTSFNSSKDMAEVVVNQLRKVGIRATVDGQTFVAYRKKQADGKLNALANAWSAGSSSDVSSTINFFYDPGPRDYFQDPELHKLREIGLQPAVLIARTEHPLEPDVQS